MKKIILATAVILITVLLSCKKSSSNNSTTVDCTNSTAKFSTDASPVIMSKCATNSSCHASGASNSGGVLTTYTLIVAKKSNIRSSIINGSMPQGSSLTTAEKQAIVCWIDNGALNN
jgi:hypothetical protein